jgi:lysozyme
MSTYTVKSGDNLAKIAGKYGTTWQQLWEWNKDTLRSGNPNLIYPGETLRVTAPTTTTKTTTAPKTTTTSTTTTPATSKTVTAPKTTATQTTAPNPLTDYKPSPFPYEEALKSLMQNVPQWQQSPEQMLEQAERYASLQVDPQQQALQRALEQAIASAQGQEERIRAAYAGVPSALERAEQRQAATDLESAISRGAGRSGVADWLAAQRQEYYNQALSEAKAKEAAELTAVANALGLTQQQAQEQQQQLEALRGTLTQQHLAALQDLSYQRGLEGWQNQTALAQQLASMSQAWDAAQWARALDTFERTMLTPYQQHQLNIGYGDIIGEMPAQMIDPYGALLPAPKTASSSSSKSTTTSSSTKTKDYTIKAGDTLSALAKKFGTTVSELMKLNPQIKDPNLIYAGKTFSKEKGREGGYPDCRPWRCRES